MINEEWRLIPNCIGYEVSSAGRVRSCQRTFVRSNGHLFTVNGRILAPCTDSRGYLNVKAGSRANSKVHQLVATAFIGPRKVGQEVCHLNGDKLDNRASNLRYGTHSDNQQDRTRHGTNGHKLSASDVFVIRERRAAGETIAAIASDFGVTDVMVSKIARRKLWKTVA